jgi:putative flavoprotein involved in K+ transport
MHDIGGVLRLFGDVCFWRDFLALTWTLRTFEGRETIAAMLSQTLAEVRPTGSAVDPLVAGDTEEGWVSFETALGRGHGHVRIRSGRRCTFLSALQELKGFEERIGEHRPLGITADGRFWRERLTADAARVDNESQPYVVLIGGSQSG